MAKISKKYGVSILLTLAVVTIAGIFRVVNASAQECPHGIVSYWKLDEDSGNIAYDSVGTNHGTVHRATWTTGQVNGALSFNNNNYIDAGNDLNLDLANSDFTIEGWFVRYSLDRGSAENDELISKHTWIIKDRATYDIFFGHPNFDNILKNRFTVNNGIWVTISFGVVTTTDVWYHFALVRSGNKMYTYFDGVYRNQADLTEMIIDSIPTAGLAIGQRDLELPTYINNPFNGIIDEVAIWNRALSAEEILQHYQNGLNRLGYVVVYSIPSPDEGGVFCPYQNITFTAVTSPPGYEYLIQWSGGENPATGTGASFTTNFSTSGAKTVTASCGASSVNRTIIILSIGSISTAMVIPPEEMFIMSSPPFPTDTVVQHLQTQIEEIAPFIVTDESGIQRLLTAEARHAKVSVDTLALGHKMVVLNNHIVRAAMRDEEIHLPASDFAFIEPFFQYQAQTGSHCGSFRNPTPCPPWVESGVYFPTRDEIVQHLLSLGYHQTERYATTGGAFGDDYTLVVPHPTCGTGPFRTQAIISQQGDCWTYSTQCPEPNPEFCSYTWPHVWWVGYVAWWHHFFC